MAAMVAAPQMANDILAANDASGEMTSLTASTSHSASRSRRRQVKRSKSFDGAETVASLDSIPEDLLGGSGTAHREESCGPTGRKVKDDSYCDKVASARARYHLPELKRNPQLDDLARSHVKSMTKRGRVMHSVASHAKLQERLHSQHVGENVHTGKTVNEIWDYVQSGKYSISKGNVLSEKFNEMGLAIRKDKNGTIYLCQLFRQASGSPEAIV